LNHSSPLKKQKTNPLLRILPTTILKNSLNHSNTPKSHYSQIFDEKFSDFSFFFS